MRPYFTTIPLPADVDVKAAFRMVQAEFPDYVRVLNWQRPKQDYGPPD